MSEHLNHHESHHPAHHEALEHHHETKHASEHTTEKASQHEDLDKIRQSIEATAISGHELQVDNTPRARPSTNQFYVQRELKSESLKRTLNRVRKHLSRPQKMFSKTIHQPVVDTLSHAAETTIARPLSLMLAGGAALVASSYMFYTAKRYGYSYNYLTTFLIFAGAYLVGLIIETAVYVLSRFRTKTARH